MQKIFLLFSLLTAVAASGAYRNTELLWQSDFSSAESLKGWSGGSSAVWLPKGGPDGKPAISFSLAKPGTRWMTISLDPAKVRGLIQLEATVRGRDLTQGSKSYLGSKVMLSYTAGGRTRNPEPMRRFGTYDWTAVSMVQEIPDNVETISLSLGIQEASGTFEVADVKIYRCVEADDPGLGKPPVNREAQAIPRGPGRGTKYRGFMSGGDLSPEAFRTLADWNVNLIRFQMNPGRKTDISTPEKYLAWIDSEIKRLDELMPLLKQHGIKVAIDLHTGPGTEINKVASNVLGKSTDLGTLEKAWRKIAEHYRGNPQVYGYDLLNEPVASNYLPGIKNPWKVMAERLTKAIRQVDPETPIIVAWHQCEPFLVEDAHIIYTPHFYSPHAYTHQGVLGQVRWSYPGMIDGVYWDKEQLRVDMKPVIEFQKKYNVPIFVGEFSVINWARGGDQYLKDTIELFEEYGWDWTYHAFREWGGWSLEYQGTDFGKMAPSADNARKRVVLEALKKNAK